MIAQLNLLGWWNGSPSWLWLWVCDNTYLSKRTALYTKKGAFYYRWIIPVGWYNFVYRKYMILMSSKWKLLSCKWHHPIKWRHSHRIKENICESSVWSWTVSWIGKECLQLNKISKLNSYRTYMTGRFSKETQMASKHIKRWLPSLNIIKTTMRQHFHTH